MCCCLIKLQIIQPLIKKVNKQNKSFCEAHYFIFIWILRQCSLFSWHLVGQSEHHTSSAVEVWCWEHPQEESSKQETGNMEAKKQTFWKEMSIFMSFSFTEVGFFLFFLEEGKVIKEYQKIKVMGCHMTLISSLLNPSLAV